jgi:hypothetical protein
MSRDSTSNNIYYGMPPLMHDGRNYSSWQPEAIINAKIKSAEGIQSNWDYRRFLQTNASNIMKYNYLEAVNASGNNPSTNVNNKPTNNSPFVLKSIYDTSRPIYGYNNSDLKQSYLSREQLHARMVAPSLPISTISTNY